MLARGVDVGAQDAQVPADAGEGADHLASGGGGQRTVRQARLPGPMDQVMGRDDEAQEGEDGQERPRAQGLDVVDVAGTGEEWSCPA